jgi:VacB/RNase II family 3'-5' exoribonuclease
MERLTTSELSDLAGQEMQREGFETAFPAPVLAEVENLQNPAETGAGIQDLRKLLWSSIDDASSRDLDQVEYVETLEDNRVRLLVGIADVDAFVPKGSATDRFAAKNTVSIYAGSRVFPMLPEQLSTNLTSLVQDEDRLAMITEIVLDAAGSIEGSTVFRAVVRNYAKLSYESVGAWLDENAPVPNAVARIEGMEAQIRLQRETAGHLRKLRQQNGALEFETIESRPVVENEQITGLTGERPNSARDIIENFMVTANVVMAEFLENRNVASLRRVVKSPERWNRIVEVASGFGEHLPAEPDSHALAQFLNRRRAADPEHFPDLSLSVIKLLGAGEYVVQEAGQDAGGHFGLAVADYTHSTAPNRRYTDLVIQRLVKATLEGRPSPYSVDDLTQIADHCNERASAARKLERQMRKSIAASVMAPRIGESFSAIVTGVTPRGTFARILNPPVDGRILHGEQSLEVGQKIRVRLINTNPRLGFIDFARD